MTCSDFTISDSVDTRASNRIHEDATRARAHTRLWNSSFPPSNGIPQASVVSPSSSNNWVAMLFVDSQPYIRVSKYLVKPLPQKWKRIRSVSTCYLITHLHCEFVFLVGWCSVCWLRISTVKRQWYLDGMYELMVYTIYLFFK